AEAHRVLDGAEVGRTRVQASSREVRLRVVESAGNLEAGGETILRLSHELCRTLQGLQVRTHGATDDDITHLSCPFLGTIFTALPEPWREHEGAPVKRR